jgi:adenylate cyclase
VLEGSVQKTAARIRITAQLIDATSGHHLWSERYDRGHEDLFDIQDDITMEIVKALQVDLIEGEQEQARIWQKKGTSNLMAYEKVLKARQYRYKIGLSLGPNLLRWRINTPKRLSSWMIPWTLHTPC